MGSFFSALIHPGSWNQAQWLAIAIAAFVLVASVYFVVRLYQIVRSIGKSTYKPNIGLSRTARYSIGAVRQDNESEQE